MTLAGKSEKLGEKSVPLPHCLPQVPNIRSKVWENIQMSHGKAKEVLSYNGILETKRIINFKN